MDEPKFSIALDQQEIALQLGEQHKCKVTFTPLTEVTDQDIVWSSTDGVGVGVGAGGFEFFFALATRIIFFTLERSAAKIVVYAAD